MHEVRIRKLLQDSQENCDETLHDLIAHDFVSATREGTIDVQECTCAAVGRLQCETIIVSCWDHLDEIDAHGLNDGEILLVSSEVTQGLCCEPNIIADYLLQACKERLECIKAVRVEPHP